MLWRTLIRDMQLPMQEKSSIILKIIGKNKNTSAYCCLMLDLLCRAQIEGQRVIYLALGVETGVNGGRSWGMPAVVRKSMRRSASCFLRAKCWSSSLVRDVSRASNSFLDLQPEDLMAERQLPFMLIAAARILFILNTWSCNRLSTDRRKESSILRVWAERVVLTVVRGREVQLIVHDWRALRVAMMAECCLFNKSMICPRSTVEQVGGVGGRGGGLASKRETRRVVGSSSSTRCNSVDMKDPTALTNGGGKSGRCNNML